MSDKKTVTIWLSGLAIAGVLYGVFHFKDQLFTSNENSASFDATNVVADTTTNTSTNTSNNEAAASNSSTETSNNVEETTKDSYSSVASITKENVGDTITIKGAIQSQSKSKDGKHTFLTVADEASNTITVPIFADKHISNEFKTNEEYLFTGLVDEYNNELEVIPQKPEDIAPVQKQVDVSEDTVGQTKTIKASVLTKYEHPDGHTFMNVLVQDSKQELEIPIFKNLNFDDSKITINALIEVSGVVTVYNDKLEIVPKNVTDIKVITPGDDSKVTLVPIGKLTEQDRGTMHQVQGYVTDATEHDGHLFFTFVDKEKKHSIKGVLFRADGNEISGRKTKILSVSKDKFPIRILAMVDVYKNELELIIDKVYNDYNG
ncbi:single stranded DNA-binding domain-containing protein [Paenibacillus albus]|uniref:OB domain-containing protein n=1 Tax=Paenibacillus albus TaxID=2495582 RepID=A0A3Q8X4S1_9BACL|nr:hypothetical protein [Paenibacillus albus]AZN40388.1 hypothetical protein EJC50_12565 [Paenibacillus albus]